MKITIGHLYPDLLNLYGDRGNIQCLMKRCLWRGIEAETIPFELDDKIDFSKLDIVLLGGGSDREQMIVCEKLQEIQPDFKAYVEDNGVVIAICGGYQLLGKYYKTEQGNIKGLDLVDLYTGHPYFSTDTATVLRAVEIEAEAILLAKAVDGIYDSDPKTNPNAVKYDEISIEEVVAKKLAAMDLTASIMCMEQKMPMLVFALDEKDSIINAVHGKFVGTKVTV